MKWTGHSAHDNILTLLDDSSAAILGQVIRDGEGGGWHARDYVSNNGRGTYIGLFENPARATGAVMSSVLEAMKAMDKAAQS